MINISELSLASIKNYYSILEQNGFIPDSEVYKVLLLSFLSELLEDRYAYYLTDKDLKLIINIASCLSTSSCVIPFLGMAIDTEPVKGYANELYPRITEDSIIRITEDDIIRATEGNKLNY